MTRQFEQPASPGGDDFFRPALRRSKLFPRLPGRNPEARFERLRNHAYSIGLLVPTSGLEGIWGPSTIACARLAVEEINRCGGLLGKEVRLQVIDAADDAAGLTEQTDQALEDGEIDAIVGMHISSVRQRLVRTVGGRVPYVYTPLYEGGERSPGVYAIGETPSEQLRPAIHALAKRFRLTRWALLGNDYVWPRISHTLAKGYIRETGGQVVDDLYLPLGVGDFGPVLERLARLKADALLLSLIGQDAIAFNREFGSAPSRTRGLVRLSCAIEENELLAIGTGNTEGLYATAGYFASTPTDANMAFKERYYSVLGEHAPTLNTLGQSTYEGVQFLAALVQQAHSQRKPWQAADIKPICYRSARETAYLDNRRKTSPMYLARAEGHLLQVIERL